MMYKGREREREYEFCVSERKKLRRRDKKVLGMSVCACVMGKEKYRETERKIKCFLYIMEGEEGKRVKNKELWKTCFRAIA